MTVNNVLTYTEFTGDGVTTDFVFHFVVADIDDVECTIDSIQTFATITPNADQSSSPGGTASFAIAPANGANVLIKRVTPLIQSLSYPAYTRFPSAQHEWGLDKLTMITQELTRTDEELLFQIQSNDADIFALQNEKADKTINVLSSDTQAFTVIDPTLADDVTLNPITNVANGLLKLDGSGNVPGDRVPSKADVTTSVISGDAETLTITNPTLANDVTLNTVTNVANGLLKLDGTAKIPAAYLPASFGAGDFLADGSVPMTGDLNLDDNSVEFYDNLGSLTLTLGFHASTDSIRFNLSETSEVDSIQFYSEGNFIGRLSNNIVDNTASSYPGVVFSRVRAIQSGFTARPVIGDVEAPIQVGENNNNNLKINENGILFANDGSYAIGALTANQFITRCYSNIDNEINTKLTLNSSSFVFEKDDGVGSPLEVVFQSADPSAGGLQVNNQLTGAGLERVLTQSDSTKSPSTSLSSVAGVVSLVWTDGSYFTLTLTENVTSWNITNNPGIDSGGVLGGTIAIHITQGAGAYTVALPAGGSLKGGNADAMPTGNGDVALLFISTFDASSSFQCTWGVDYA